MRHCVAVLTLLWSVFCGGYSLHAQADSLSTSTDTIIFEVWINPDTLPDFYTRPYSMWLHTNAIQMDSSQKNSFPAAMAFGLSSGTKGFLAADLAVQLYPHLHARLGFSYLDWQPNDIQVELQDHNYGDETLLFDGTIQQNTLELLIDYGFLGDRLRVVAGAAYFLDNEFGGEGVLSEGVQYNDVPISPEEVGYLKGRFFYEQKVAPYLGIGIGRTIPQSRVGVSADVGAWYRGEPSVDIEASNLLRYNAEKEAQLEENLSFMQWYPVVAVRLAYRIF